MTILYNGITVKLLVRCTNEFLPTRCIFFLFIFSSYLMAITLYNAVNIKIGTKIRKKDLMR